MSEEKEVSTVEPSEIIPCFTISSRAIREVAYQEACKMASSEQVCDALLSVWKNGKETPHGWSLVLKAFAVHGKGNPEAIEVLRQNLDDPNEELRISTAETLFAVGGDTKLALETISPFLKVENLNIRLHAVSSLCSFGKSCLPLVNTLAEIASNEDEYGKIRVKALNVLCTIGSEAKVASPTLAKILHTQDAEVLVTLLENLEVIGVTREAIPNLIAALNYKDPNTGHIRNRHPGIMFLGGIDMHAVVVKLLGSLGKEAEGVLPNLEELLRRETNLEDWKKRLDEDAEKHNAPILAEFEKDLNEGKKVRKPRKGYRLKEGSEQLFRTQIRLTSLEAKKATIEAIDSIKHALHA